MSNDVIIREVRPLDSVQLSELYDRVWPGAKGRHLSKTIWAINTSEFPGFCCEKSGVIIGSRTCFHTNIFIGKEKVTCVQFGDSCVDKDFRRFGLFTQMNRVFLENYFKTGDELIYNISVDASRKAYEKLGWNYIHSLSNVILIHHPLSFLIKTKGRLSLLSGNMIADDCSIPDVSVISNDLLSKRESLFESSHCIHTRYDIETLTWRIKSDSNIKLFFKDGLGACFYKIGKKNGLRCCTIGEVFLFEYTYGNFKKLLKILQSGVNADVTNTVITHAHPLFHWYRCKGFLCNPKKVYLNHGVKVESEIMKSICYNPDNWALSNLDIDTF